MGDSLEDDFAVLLGALRRILGRLGHLSPVFAFTVAVSSFAWAVILAGWSGDRIFCAESDGSGVICARNWASAIGTPLSAAIAVLTAAIVLGQLRVARSQSHISVIPTLDRRVELISEVYILVKKLIANLYESNECLRVIEEYMIHSVTPKSVVDRVEGLIACQHNRDIIRTEMRSMLDDLRIDADIRVNISKSYDASFLSSIRQYHLIWSSIERRKTVSGNLRVQLLYDDLQSIGKSEIKIASQKVKIKEAEVLDIAIDLEQMASQTSRAKIDIVAAI